MAGARVPFANFCPVCGAKAGDLRPETTLQINTYPWTCRACGHQWIMVAAGASLQGNWSSSAARPPSVVVGPRVVAGTVLGRVVTANRGRR